MATRVKPNQTIARETRRDIMDSLAADPVNWWGRLDDVKFLGRIWDLTELPSTDYRHKDAAGDIWQHTISNPSDWDPDWIFHDDRFDLAGCPDEIFIRFLCEMALPLALDFAHGPGQGVARRWASESSSAFIGSRSARHRRSIARLRMSDGRSELRHFFAVLSLG